MAQNREEIARMMEELGCTGEHITASGIQDRIEAYRKMSHDYYVKHR